MGIKVDQKPILMSPTGTGLLCDFNSVGGASVINIMGVSQAQRRIYNSYMVAGRIPPKMLA